MVSLQGVSLEVRVGEAVGLVGTNGAGKTLLKTIAGSCRPERRDLFDGRRIDVVEAPDRVDLGIALVPEGRRLFSSRSVAENLRLGTFSRPRPEAPPRDARARVRVVPGAAAARGPARGHAWGAVFIA